MWLQDEPRFKFDLSSNLPTVYISVSTRTARIRKLKVTGRVSNQITTITYGRYIEK